ncbi:MAG: hypothetical protein ABSF66_00820 [Terriglobales bacterium]|jgi:hypothetical protein
MDTLLTYKEVKKVFGWKSNTSIQERLEPKGLLVRVFLSRSLKSARVTAASVQKYQASLTDIKDAQTEFNVSGARWAKWAAAKKLETEAEVQAKADNGTPTEDFYAIGDVGLFAPTAEWSPDGITGEMTPPGCYRDAGDGLVCGIPSPRESQRAFLERCRRRGIRPSRSKYLACIVDGNGKYRVNDVPKEEQSVPSLEYTKPMGTKGGV